MKHYRISEKDLQLLLNSLRISMADELSMKGIKIPEQFEVELDYDGQYSLTVENCMRECNIPVEIIKQSNKL